MPVRQWATTWDNLARCVITNRLELPHAANQFEVADVQTSFGQHAADAGADRVKPELVHAVSAQPRKLLRNDANHLQALVRVTPFVVVPGDDFDEGAV